MFISSISSWPFLREKALLALAIYHPAICLCRMEPSSAAVVFSVRRYPGGTHLSALFDRCSCFFVLLGFQRLEVFEGAELHSVLPVQGQH